MAEFLIKALDSTHPVPEKDQRGCYKMGDIVSVQPDGHAWGVEECLPKFYVFKVPGLSVEDALQYAVPDYVLGHPDFGIAVRRKFRFPFWAKVPPETLGQIESSDWLVMDIPETDIEVKA